MIGIFSKTSMLSLAIASALACASGAATAATASAKSRPGSDAEASTPLLQLADTESLAETWRNYALSTIKAQFTWASEPGESVVEVPTIFNRGRGGLKSAPAMRFPGTSVQASGPFEIAMQSVRASNAPLYAQAEASNLLQDHAPGLRRTMVTPSVTGHFGEGGQVSVAAIFAYERLAGFDVHFGNLAPMPTFENDSQPPLLRNQSTASGAGARIDFSNNFNPWIGWQAGLQSRINMDGFNTAEGLYARRNGMFDIPASMNIGLNFNLGSGFQADAGVERLLYSQIPPYISTDLPPELLVQIGSYRNTSLVWENLLVRSAGLSWHDSDIGELRLGITTRQQPLPTLASLQRAVMPMLSQHSYELSYARAFGDRSTLRFLGVYAPLQLLGAPTANYLFDGTSGQNQLRVEALWTTQF